MELKLLLSLQWHYSVGEGQKLYQRLSLIIHSISILWTTNTNLFCLMALLINPHYEHIHIHTLMYYIHTHTYIYVYIQKIFNLIFYLFYNYYSIANTSKSIHIYIFIASIKV